MDTSPPSERKLGALERQGVEVYQLNADKINPQIVLQEPVIVHPLVTQRCGKALRKECNDLYRWWVESENPFIGIRMYPSGARDYLYGDCDPEGRSWSYGDPEVHGLCRMDAKWSSVPSITPVGKPRTLTRQIFLTYLAWQRGLVMVAANSRPSDGTRWVGLTQLEAALVRYIDELLFMDSLPSGSQELSE